MKFTDPANHSPKAYRLWAFRTKESLYFTPRLMSLREAKAWLRETWGDELGNVTVEVIA